MVKTLVNSTKMNEENIVSDESDMEENEYYDSYEDEEDVWEGPNGEDVCYDITCHDHVHELQQIVARWTAHNEGNNFAKRFEKDMEIVHNATSELLSIEMMPEVTFRQWEECEHSLEQGAVT